METVRPLLPARVQEVVEVARPRVEAAAVAPASLPARSMVEPEIRPVVAAVSTPAGIAAAIAAKPSNACDWALVQAAAAGERRQLKMVVEEASLVEFKEGCVELRVAPDLMTAAMGVQDDIKQLITRTWGRSVRLEFATELTAPANRDGPVASGLPRVGSGVASGEGPIGAVPEVGPAMTVANAMENPLIAKAAELLGAKVVGVYVRQK